MKRLLLIINPCAGQKKVNKHILEIVGIFNRAGYGVLTHVTAGPGDGEAAVLAHADQVERVVCCGGDGTFNEVLSGVMKSGRPLPVGYIPAGTTNDFAVSLGLKTGFLQAAQDIVLEGTRQLDVGRCGDRYFSYVASFGAFTRTSCTTPQIMKNLLGHAAYILSSVRELSQLKPWQVKLELSDGTVVEDEFLVGSVSNSTSVGGVLTLDKSQVDLSDGIFEILLIRCPKDLKELADCVVALQQKRYDDTPLLTFLRTDQVTITGNPEMPWTVDGEMAAGSGEVTIQCLHKAVQMITGG